MTSVAIIDFGLCNLDSITRAVEECGGTPIVTAERKEIEAAAKIILPGVGAYPLAMANIRAAHLDEILTEKVVAKETPCLGICLGMHLLAASGEEEGGCTGLGFIGGQVKRMEPKSKDERIPHVGWNEVNPQTDHPLFAGIPGAADFYFVHGYHFDCTDPGNVLAETPYCGGVASAVCSGNVLGVQFHPEKSQKWGFTLLRNFLEKI